MDGFFVGLIRQSRSLLVVAFLILVIGLATLPHLNIEAYPDPAPPLIEVLAQRPGWSAEEMERLVSVPLETSLQGMPNLVDVRSTSLLGLTDIKCYFRHDSSYREARQEVLNRLPGVDLPDSVHPTISPQSTIGEILRYQLVSSKKTLMELKEINDWYVVRQLRQVAGVVDVTSWGGPTKQFQFILDPRRLLEKGIGFDLLRSQFSRGNNNVGAETLTIGQESFNVRGIGLYRNCEDIGLAQLTQHKGIPVMARDVGQAIEGKAVAQGRVGRDDADDIVEGIVLMRVGERTGPTLAGVHQKIAQINKELEPQGVQLVPYNDRSDLLSVTVSTVSHTLISGMILVSFILFAFLGDLRASLIVSLTIPISLCCVFAILVWTGQSANLISMGAIDFGIIVDASVIMIENVHRHLSAERASEQPVLEVCLEAAQEVARPLTFSSLILFVSFIPLFTMKGVEAKIFGPMAVTYALALAISLLLARTFAPACAALFLKASKNHQETPVVRFLVPYYLSSLGWCLRYCHIFFVTALLACIALIIGSVSSCGGEYMPKLEEGNLWVRGTLPISTPFGKASECIGRARKILRACPQVRTVVSQLGRPDDATDPTSWFNMEFYAPLIPQKDWPAGLTKVELIARLQKQLQTEVPEAEFGFSQAIQDNVEEATSGVKGENIFKVFGPDLTELERLGTEVRNLASRVRGVEDLGIYHTLGQPNLLITPDRLVAARYGLDVQDVNDTLSLAAGGFKATEVFQGDRRFDLVIRYAQDFRDDPEKLSQLLVPGDSGSLIPLGQLAKIERKMGAGLIYRENGRRYLPVKFSVRGRDLSSTVAELDRQVREHVKFPAGYSVEISGEYEHLQDAIRNFSWTVPVTGALMFLILLQTFGNLVDALVVLGSIPLAVSGGLLAIALRGMPLSVSAGVGLISLSGVCVMEALLLVSIIRERFRSQAVGVCLKEACVQRLRPVLMVAIAAAAGLIPAALSNQIGSETQKPLATVVVGGMPTALLVILFVIPAFYQIWLRPKTQ